MDCKWVKEQIRQKGGIACKPSSTGFFEIGPFYVSAIETPYWGEPRTMVSIFYKPKDTTVSVCWMVDNASDRKKTKKILKALANPTLLPTCKGMGIDEIIKASKEELCPIEK